MFRYRCPQCNQILQAPEIRAGKTTVCSRCSQPLTIPADKAHWLNEKGEPLLTSPTVVISAAAITPPPFIRPPVVDDVSSGEADNDVLGAIFLGAISPSAGSPSAEVNIDMDTAPEPASAFPPAPPHPVPMPAPEKTPEPAAERKPAPRPVAPDSSSQTGRASEEPSPPPAPVPAAQHEPTPAPTAEALPAPAAPEPTPVPARYPTPLPRSIPRRPAPPEPEPRAPVAAVSDPKPPAPTPPPRRPVPTPPPRGRGGERPFGSPVAVDSARGLDWGGASSRSGHRPHRVVTTSPVDDGGAVAMDEPLRLRTQMDIAAELTAALTTRMKPPPKPPRDLKPSTALWILATGVAVALLILTLASARNFVQEVIAIGIAQVLAGYLWIVFMAYRRNPERGVICAIPPLTFWYLAQWKYARYRPLRFVVTGAALAGLGGAASYAQPHTRTWAGVADPAAAPVPAPEITSQPKLAQLRHFRDKREYDALVALLRTLARTDPRYSDEAKNRVELAAELRALCGHTDSGVKVEAMAAYAAWGGEDARGLCLEASRSVNREERLMALRLLPRWKDEFVARAIAERIGRPGTETSSAQQSLVELGGPVAERATIPLLRNDEQGIRLTAIDILGNEKVGGPDAVAALLEVARTTGDPGTRQPAVARADQIKARLAAQK